MKQIAWPIGWRLRGMLIARDVDGGGRVRVHTRSRLDLLLYRMVLFWAFRLMMRWSPVRRPHSSELIRISPLLIRTRKRRRQKTVAPRRSTPRGPGVLGTSRVPSPLSTTSYGIGSDAARRQRSLSGRTPIATGCRGGFPLYYGR